MPRCVRTSTSLPDRRDALPTTPARIPDWTRRASISRTTTPTPFSRLSTTGTGWRDLGVSAFAYLTAPWPRYGVNGAAVHLKGRGDFANMFVFDIGPGRYRINLQMGDARGWECSAHWGIQTQPKDGLPDQPLTLEPNQIVERIAGPFDDEPSVDRAVGQLLGAGIEMETLSGADVGPDHSMGAASVTSLDVSIPSESSSASASALASKASTARAALDQCRPMPSARASARRRPAAAVN